MSSTKPSKVQREVMENIHHLRRDDNRGYRHSLLPTGKTISEATMDALWARDWVRLTEESRGPRTIVKHFELTDAGKAALG